ncbi:MAG: polymer-forming cytoskeletal protein [Actinomycetota bacterium]|jgi:cytoskeletal protein CcmA (bactofilin family)|nr:polymer-forming cytoskeletal protein [Actinomycetota bacterium]
MQDFSSDGYLSDSQDRTLLIIQGDTAKIDGKLKISQSIEIDCEVLGELEVDGQLLISEKGFVSADVKTADAVILGRYEGSMEATGTVEIKETGVVNGNIKTDSLIINRGGKFDGNVCRITDSK